MCENCNADHYISVADSIINIARRIDEESGSERGVEFADSVSDKAFGMKEWMEAKEHVTDKMKNALDNMLEGAGRWIE